VTDRGIADDGSIADIPWAAVYDPAHNIRSFNTIQARGFRAATDVVERLIDMIGQNGGGAAVGRLEPTSTEEQVNGLEQNNGASMPPTVERAVSAYQSVLAQLLDSMRGSATTPAGMVKLDLEQGNSRELLYLEAMPGGAASTELWLHNGGPSDLGDISLRCSDLLGHDGEILSAETVRIDPRTVSMPDRCSRGVTVQVDVAEDAQPGRYRGTLLASGHPDVWLPLELKVLTVLAAD
jgi:hypothetical protein